jgi:RimJ/RimL family protein N-acetyltransferase
MFAYRSHPEVVRYQLWEPMDVEEIGAFIAQLAEVPPGTPGTWHQLGILRKENGDLIGDCGIHFPPDEARQAEVGITIAPDHQGRGYATEALEAVLDRLFTRVGMHRISGRVDPRNAASIALLERMGMKREGHLRESVWVRGEWTDDLIYAVLEWEWRGRQPLDRHS